LQATPTTEIYTLSLHDALPISDGLIKPHPTNAQNSTAPMRTRTNAMSNSSRSGHLTDQQSLIIRSRTLRVDLADQRESVSDHRPDRKSTRLNSSHVKISYAVLCLKE